MRSPRALGGLAIVALLVSAVAPALASPQARLVYARAEGASACPDETALRSAVAARLGYDPFLPSAPRTVIVRLSARGDALVARVQLVDDEAHAQGARDLRSRGHDCGDLIDFVALTISIAIDPRVLAATPEPPREEPAPATEPAPPAAAPAAAAPSAVASAPERDSATPATPDGAASGPRLRARLGAELRGVVWSEPGPSSGVALSAALVWPRLSLGVEAAADLPASEQDPSGGSVIAWVAAASLAPCLRFGVTRACALASLGAMEASSSGVAQQQNRTALYAALGGRAGLELPVAAHLVAFAHLDALGDLSRTTLRIGSDDVWRAPAGSLALGLGVAAYF